MSKRKTGRAALWLLLFAIALCTTERGLAQSDRTLTRPSRLALIIGNDTYAQAPLQNARNDARAVAKTLGSVGFRVTLLEDVTRERFGQALEDFSNAAQPTDVVVFYFAGHGLEVDAQNFLVPVDYRGTSEQGIKLNGIAVSLIAQILSRAKASVLILDACRNNPFKGQRSTGGGLAPMEVVGSLIAYATAAGQTASDNAGASNGLFTSEILKAFQKPGLSVTEMFKQVKQNVYTASNQRQLPAVYDNLVGELVLRPTTSGDVSGDPGGGGTTASTASRIIVDTDTTVTVTANGSAIGTLKEGETRTIDVLPGDQVVQFRTTDGTLADTITTTVPRGEQRLVSIRIRERIATAIKTRADAARKRFESLLDIYNRDIRQDLQQAFDELRASGAVSQSNDEDRFKNAMVGSYSEWMSSADYQAEFERRKLLGLFASPNEGRNNAGQSQYRAYFRRPPVGFRGWECRHSLTKDQFDQRNTALIAQGFRQVAQQTFTDSAGVVRYQATWIRFP